MNLRTRTPVVARTLAGATALAAIGIATLGAAPATLGAAPANADDEVAVDPCDLSKTVVQLQNFGDDTSKNVIVYNKGHEESANFEGIVKEGVVKATGCDEVPLPGVWDEFRFVVFSGKGEFDRKGDGGYRNWAFAGDFDRTADDHVEFHAR